MSKTTAACAATTRINATRMTKRMRPGCQSIGNASQILKTAEKRAFENLHAEHPGLEQLIVAVHETQNGAHLQRRKSDRYFHFSKFG